MCVHVQVPALRLGTKQIVPPREAGALGHCPSGHSGKDRCYLSVVGERVQEIDGERERYS